MGFKKGAAAVKNVTPKGKGKKAFEVPEEEDDDLDMFEDMQDSDDDESGSEEEAPVQKTPVSKIKARQSISEKKVSFQIPGKNTPNAKTPKDNASSGKKQTPAKGKSQVQEFKGLKGNKKQAEQDDEDDDDDEEDDEDFEPGMDVEDDLDLELDDDDEEEEDDDDEDDEDDDEEDEDEDEKVDENNAKQKLASLKQNSLDLSKQKTPLKSKTPETPKGQTPKKGAQTPKVDIKQEKASPKGSMMVQPQSEIDRRNLRDSKMLYVGNLPKDSTAEELKTLSVDIEEVMIPSRHHRTNNMFAFLVFSSEAKAEANHELLKTKKFRGQLLKIDFVGAKSLYKKPGSNEENQHKVYNMKKLFVTGIPVEATIAQVAEFFPMAVMIAFNQSPLYRTATITYNNEEAANDAFETNREITLHGHKLVVLHSMIGKSNMNKKNNKKRFRPKSNGNFQGANPAKKMKFKKENDE